MHSLSKCKKLTASRCKNLFYIQRKNNVTEKAFGMQRKKKKKAAKEHRYLAMGTAINQKTKHNNPTSVAQRASQKHLTT